MFCFFSKPVYSIVFLYYCNTCNSFYLDVNYRKPPPSVTHIYSLAFTRTHTRTLFSHTLFHTHTRSFTNTLSSSLSHTHTRTLFSHTLFHTQTRSFTNTLSSSLSHTHTHKTSYLYWFFRQLQQEKKNNHENREKAQKLFRNNFIL